jgi:anti-anti-sigma regulatory factor
LRVSLFHVPQAAKDNVATAEFGELLDLSPTYSIFADRRRILMPSGNEPYEQADIRIGEVIWSKTMKGSDAIKQKEHLSQLAEMAEAGVILDCALIEVANSELLNLLVRVRTLTKKMNKGFALFNVSEALSNTIKVCKMGSLLPIASDMVEAKKLVYGVSRGKGGLTQTLKRIFKS